jgi:hypothetical protein
MEYVRRTRPQRKITIEVPRFLSQRRSVRQWLLRMMFFASTLSTLRRVAAPP